jgi:hypothetical protein
LNKQLRTADKGWPFSLAAGREVITHHRKISNLLRNIAESLGHSKLQLYKIFWNTEVDILT